MITSEHDNLNVSFSNFCFPMTGKEVSVNASLGFAVNRATEWYPL